MQTASYIGRKAMLTITFESMPDIFEYPDNSLQL